MTSSRAESRRLLLLIEVSLALLVPCGIGISAAAKEKEYAVAVGSTGNPVHSLTGETFQQFITQNDVVLLEFISPTCGHCKELQPAYEAVAGMLGEKGIPLAKIDANKETELSKKYKINKYPTILWFENGEKLEEYTGPRDAESMFEWVSQRAGPPVVETNTPADPKNAKPRLVLYADTLLPAFYELAKSSRRKATWYFVKGSSSESPKVVLDHLDEDPVTLEDLSPSSLDAFLKKYALPLFGRIDQESMSRYLSCGKGLVWMFFGVNETTGMDMAEVESRAKLEVLAKETQDTYVWTFMDMSTHNDDAHKLFGITVLPALVVQEHAGDKQFHTYIGEISYKPVKTFLDGIASGKLVPFVKSEATPKSNLGPVKVVVARTLENEVFTKDKDVLLEIYAPWCEHCKALEPEYTKLGEKVRKLGLTGLIKIAKIDGTANNSPIEAISWASFPTIYLIKAGMSTPLRFKGISNPNADDLWRFIRKEGSNIYEVDEVLKEHGIHDEL